MSWATLLAQADDSILEDSVSATDWISAAVILVVGFVVAAVAARLVRTLLRRAVSSGFIPLIASRVTAYAVGLLAIIYALGSLGVAVGPLVGALGLSGLVLALALQPFVENLVAGVLLQARRPFTIHEIVRVGDCVGEVIDIDVRTVVLSTLDGTVLRIPNTTVFSSEIENLTRRPVRRSTLEVGVAYASDLQIATDAVQRAVESIDEVRHEPAPRVLLTRFGASSIDLTAYYWHSSDVPTELATRHGVIGAIHRELAAVGVEIAFPQLTIWQGRPAEWQPSSVSDARS